MERRTVRRLGILAALALLLAVSGVVLTAAFGRNDHDASAAGTVRAFLIDTAVDGDGVAGCRYLTPAERRHVETTAPPDASCEIALLPATLRLGGRTVATEAAIKRLDYSVHLTGALDSVTVRAPGAAAGMTIGLRRATAAEMGEFQAPPTQWRIESGATQLLAGT